MQAPLILTKAWLADHFGHSFQWIRKNVLTDEVLTNELEFDLSTFKQWRSIPAKQGNKLKQWLAQNNLN